MLTDAAAFYISMPSWDKMLYSPASVQSLDRQIPANLTVWWSYPSNAVEVEILHVKVLSRHHNGSVYSHFSLADCDRMTHVTIAWYNASAFYIISPALSGEF